MDVCAKTIKVDYWYFNFLVITRKLVEKLTSSKKERNAKCAPLFFSKTSVSMWQIG